MSTRHSPTWQLAGEAARIAASMKKAERGEILDARILEARKSDPFKVAVVMDDKLISIEMAWADIAKASEAELAAMVLMHMREENPQ